MKGRKKKIPLQWAVEKGTNKLLSIMEVRNGKACNCICPDRNCQWPLEAVHPDPKNKITPHFRHRADEQGNISPCSDAIALESAIHLMAKEIILKKSQIYIYPFRHSFPKYRNEIISSILMEKFTKEERIYLPDLKVEQRIFANDFQPDLSCYLYDIPLAIEIKRTHAVDDVKIDKLKRVDVATIEIDLSKVSESFDRKDIELAINDKSNFKWIHYPSAWVTQQDLINIENHYDSEKRRIDLRIEKANRERERKEKLELEREQQIFQALEAERKERETVKLLMLASDIINTYEDKISTFSRNEKSYIKYFYKTIKENCDSMSSLLSEGTDESEDIWNNSASFMNGGVKARLDDQIKTSKHLRMKKLNKKVCNALKEDEKFIHGLLELLNENGWTGSALVLNEIKDYLDKGLAHFLLSSIVPVLKEKIESILVKLSYEIMTP